jgi:hypothetical protein
MPTCEQPMKVPLFWFHWLLIVIAGVMLFGISMILSPGLIRRFFGLLFFASANGLESRFGAPAAAYITLVHGVLGAVMFGWGASLLLVLLGPFRRGSREGWLILTVSAAVWFVPDTLFSLWTGFWQNAVLNMVLALLFAIPLAATFGGTGPRPPDRPPQRDEGAQPRRIGERLKETP